VGRLLIVGAPKSGGVLAAYRLSSRSFPHRKIEIIRNSAKVMPISGCEEDLRKNPHTTYTCLRIIDESSILVANGEHLDPICARIESGTPAHQAIVRVLAETGPEQDIYKTPRIAGFASQTTSILGIITEKGLAVKSFPTKAGTGYYVATYEKTDPAKNLIKNLDAKSAADAAKQIHKGPDFKHFTNEISTVAALIRDGKIEIDTFP